VFVQLVTFDFDNECDSSSFSFLLLTKMTSVTERETDGSEIDPIWTTSRTARQIYALGEVDKVGRRHVDKDALNLTK